MASFSSVSRFRASRIGVSPSPSEALSDFSSSGAPGCRRTATMASRIWRYAWSTNRSRPGTSGTMSMELVIAPPGTRSDNSSLTSRGPTDISLQLRNERYVTGQTRPADVIAVNRQKVVALRLAALDAVGAGSP
jgi:hypothetical protein